MMENNSVNRIKGGVLDETNPPIEPVFIHIDIGLNKYGK